MAKSYLTNGAVIASGEVVENFIQQVSTPTGVFDMAVKQGIRFFNGQSDSNGLLWDGSAPFEVVIPAVTDIVQDPVRMVGTVSATEVDGQETIVISPNTYNLNNAVKGDLLYILNDCTFQGVVCEAGDMAIYDGTAWRVIQGENQVTIYGGSVDDSGHHTVAISGSATKVLDVEGRNLSLAIDYADVAAKMAVVKNNQSVTLSVDNGQVTVAPTYIGLSQEEGSTKDISKSVSISLPTALASGAVTISDKVLQDSDFTFTSGAFPTASKNTSDIAVSVSHNLSIGKQYTDGDTGDYVTSVDAIKAVAFTGGNESSYALAYVSGLAADTENAKSFVSGIHVFDSANESGSADFTVPGAVSISADANTFVSGLSAAADSGDVISSINVGAVTVVEGSDFLTGLSGNATSVVTDVTFGDAVKDTTLNWFLASLGNESTTSGDVVTGISVGAVTLVDAASGAGTDAMVSASVSNHVLSFTTAKFQTPVTLSKAADTVTYKTFTSAGVSRSGFTFDSTTFTKGGISQADTTMSYKSILTKAVTLTEGTAVGYKFDKEAEHAYTVVKEYQNFNYTAATVSKNTPVLNNTNITASIASDTVVVALNAGTLPELTIAAPTGTISGTVGTSLTTSDVAWLAIDESKKEFTIPGAYSLVEDSATFANAIEVGAADTYGVANGAITIPSDTFVTDVTVNGSSVSA